MAIADFLRLMPATVTYRPAGARDQYGKPTLGTAVTYRARVEYKTRRVVSRVNGQDALAIGSIWINGVITGIKTDDEITLPDGSTPIIVSWDRVQDEKGDHHMKIYFGSATSSATVGV